MKALRIFTVFSEVAPYSKSGGLGDVGAALPKHVARHGHKVSIITPFYGFMKQQQIPMEDAGEDTVTFDNQSYVIKFKRSKLRDNYDIYFAMNEDLFGRYQMHMYGHDNDALRFFVFNLAALKLIERLGEHPDIVHCHEWQTGFIPNLMRCDEHYRDIFKNTATVFTIHNLTYQMQGNWWEVPKDKMDDGKLQLPTTAAQVRWMNMTRRGITYADVINTVSVRHAQEILTPEYGQGLDKTLMKREKNVYGIVNGIDYAVFNPQFDKLIWHRYDWNSLDKKHRNKKELQKLVGLDQDTETPLIGMVHRLTEQKGLSLITQILPVLMRMKLQMVILGTGDRGYIQTFKKAAKQFPNKIGMFSPRIGSDDNNELASRIYAGSDMFLMPSRFEPCGVSQLISLRYGSIPIVHETGGLCDTITDFNPRSEIGTGFVFSRYSSEDLLVAIVRALETFNYPKVWEHLTWQAMQESYSWDIPAEKYIELYKRAQRAHNSRGEG